ncbi:class I SAM-dependent methyltransferase [Arthrobacter castelli]|uniref:class I SAM-dependent methyltransferase n=1 Tax=Arthrobacter castelli TaxID=271431 RepID=UPI0004227B96|nr:methyltransferase [Arthrobacter castelli]
MASNHYFSAQPGGQESRRPLQVVLAGAVRDLNTANGIFSPGRIDQGTAVLLKAADDPPTSGNLLDVGCGWGPMALTMALKSPQANVYAVDVNERALGLTRDNAAALGLSNVTAAAPADIDPGVRFDTIWSNPPIRVGKPELHGLLHLWINRLAPGGTAWLVVQRNLGSDSLQRWMTAEFSDQFTVSRAHSSKGFRLLKVKRTG